MYDARIPVNELLTDEWLKDFFTDGSSKYWAGQVGVGMMHDVLSGESDIAGFMALDEWTGKHPPMDMNDPDCAQFTKERFRQAIVQVALEQFMNKYDAEDSDIAIQMACFGKVIFG